MPCTVTVKREFRLGYAAAPLEILLNGSSVSKVMCGSVVAFTVPAGTHRISFSVYGSIRADLTVTILENCQSLIITSWVEASGEVEAFVGNGTVQSSISRKPSSNTWGNAIKVLLLILAVVGIYLLLNAKWVITFLPVTP